MQINRFRGTRKEDQNYFGNIKCPQSKLGTGLIEYHQRKQKREEEQGKPDKIETHGEWKFI